MIEITLPSKSIKSVGLTYKREALFSLVLLCGGYKQFWVYCSYLYRDGADYRGKRSVVESWRLYKVYDNDDDEDDSTFEQYPAPYDMEKKKLKHGTTEYWMDWYWNRGGREKVQARRYIREYERERNK